jgi:pyrimidine deaminase RibD-like protein
MDRALRDAAKGDPSPNPHVGAELVRRRKIVSLGYRARRGHAYAEGVKTERAVGNNNFGTDIAKSKLNRS